jgi:hypothetical protein
MLYKINISKINLYPDWRGLIFLIFISDGFVTINQICPKYRYHCFLLCIFELSGLTLMFSVSKRKHTTTDTGREWMTFSMNYLVKSAIKRVYKQLKKKVATLDLSC